MVTTLIPPRLGTPRNESRLCMGAYVSYVAEMMGFSFHPCQRHLTYVSTELIERTDRDPSQSAYVFNAQYVGCLVGRQSGKTAWSAARIAAQALMPNFPTLAESVGLGTFVPQHIAYTAQTRLSAMER